MIENMIKRLHDHVKSHPLDAVDFRNIFQSELFRLSMKQVSILFYSVQNDLYEK